MLEEFQLTLQLKHLTEVSLFVQKNLPKHSTGNLNSDTVERACSVPKCCSWEAAKTSCLGTLKIQED